MDLAKIKAIQECPTPRNVYEVRVFVGLASYYRRFIEVFSKIANNITFYQKKGVKFIWTHKCEDSFRNMKELLTCAPILKNTDPDKEYVVCTYAYMEGIDGVVIQ